MVIDGSHKIERVDNEHVCKVCGACTGHTPALMDRSCEAVVREKWVVAYHPEKPAKEESSTKTPSETTITNFEIRKLALNWAERNITKPVQPSKLQQFVEETENFLRTGRFHHIDKAAPSDG